MEPSRSSLFRAEGSQPWRDVQIKHRTGSVKPAAGFEHLSGTMTRGIRSFAFLRGERDSLLATLEDSKTRQWRASRIGFNELSGIRSTSDRRGHAIFQSNIPMRPMSHCPRIMADRCTRVLCRLRHLFRNARNAYKQKRHPAEPAVSSRGGRRAFSIS
jgi:hypothetical protein